MPARTTKTKPRPAAVQVPAPEREGDETIEDLDEALEVIPFTYSITAYGADYPVDGVVKRIESNDIIVPTFSWEPGPDSEVVGFQREYIWPRPKADRFIESLLLGLPVPGIFLVKEPSGRFLVLDGHQRLYTLRAFYDGVINGVEYKRVQPLRFDAMLHRQVGIVLPVHQASGHRNCSSGHHLGNEHDTSSNTSLPSFRRT